jgi:hypothetical protein
MRLPLVAGDGGNGNAGSGGGLYGGGGGGEHCPVGNHEQAGMVGALTVR